MPLSSDYVRTSLQGLYGDSITSGDIRAWCAMNGNNYQTITKKLDQYKIGRGKWNLTVREQMEQTYQSSPNTLPDQEQQNLIPQKDDTFVQFGNFTDVKKIIKSRLFYPTFITGLSGNGKTFSVEQACAQLGRELIRVNITIEPMKMILLVVSALLMVRPSGTMAQSLKHSNEELSCSLMRSTSLLTKFSVSNLSLRGKEFSLKKSDDELNLQVDSTSLPQPTLRVRVQTTDDSLELMCLTKLS